MTPRTFTKCLVATCCLLLVACGCVVTSVRGLWPLQYKPSCDIQPILTIPMPDHVETLAACPRDETYAVDGRSKDGDKWPDDTKEFFRLQRGAVRYDFWLHFDESAAIKNYQRDKHSRHVYRETSHDGRSICVYYTEQERADGEGGFEPMGIYHARASFRLRNAYVYVETTEGQSKSETLNLAVRDLAQMLTVALEATNQRAR